MHPPNIISGDIIFTWAIKVTSFRSLLSLTASSPATKTGHIHQKQ